MVKSKTIYAQRRSYETPECDVALMETTQVLCASEDFENNSIGDVNRDEFVW